MTINGRATHIAPRPVVTLKQRLADPTQRFHLRRFTASTWAAILTAELGSIAFLVGICMSTGAFR